MSKTMGKTMARSKAGQVERGDEVTLLRMDSVMKVFQEIRDDYLPVTIDGDGLVYTIRRAESGNDGDAESV